MEIIRIIKDRLMPVPEYLPDLNINQLVLAIKKSKTPADANPYVKELISRAKQSLYSPLKDDDINNYSDLR